MKTVLEYLNERLDMANHNRLCYSDSYAMDRPKAGFEREWDESVRDGEIVDELIAMVKEKETSAKQTPPAGCPVMREVEAYAATVPAEVEETPPAQTPQWRPGEIERFYQAVKQFHEKAVQVQKNQALPAEPSEQNASDENISFREKMLKQVDDFLEPFILEVAEKDRKAKGEDKEAFNRENMLIFLANLARKECRRPLNSDAQRMVELVRLALSDSTIIHAQKENSGLLRIEIVDIPYKRHFADLMIGNCLSDYWIDSYKFY